MALTKTVAEKVGSMLRSMSKIISIRRNRASIRTRKKAGKKKSTKKLKKSR
jgi:hypothetical protein